jgi:uncharacterized protein YndB with AHSA1/START domain
MGTTDSSAPRRLRVTHTVAAARERVFRAWLEPEAIRAWFLPADGSWTEPPAVDARAGGHYRFTVVHQGLPYCIHGTYLEVSPPDRLVFTWLWEDDAIRGDSGDTVVTVELFDRGGRTEIVVTHERFTSEEACEEHRVGWAGCLAEIEKLLS